MINLTLSPVQRAELRAAAHSLKPVVLIGENGLTPSVLREIDRSLAAHTLIKVRVFGDDRDTRTAINETICNQLHAVSVQQLGKLLLLYRLGEPVLDVSEMPLAATEKGAVNKRLKAAQPRTVVVRKPRKSDTRRPKAQKIKLLGNQRVTAGGNIKRTKPRQKSLKKQALADN